METIINCWNEIMGNEVVFYLLTTLVKLVIMFAVILAFVVISVWTERRVAGWIQDRPGPNRAGLPLFLLQRFGSKEKQPLKNWLHFFGIPETSWIAKLCTWLRLDREIPTMGLIQPCLDGGKLFLKQEQTPSYVRKLYFIIAPMLVLGPPLVAAAVVPFASHVDTSFGSIQMCVANLGIGPLWIFAISGLSVYGLTLAGWSSNSKFPFIGGLRATAQLISYEVSMGLAIIPLLMMFGSLNLQEIVQYQAENGWTLLPLWGEGLSLQRWAMMLPLAISFVVFVTCVFAEANRTPFDMAECETDLVGGYHTEYSSMKFASFFMGEYAAMVIGSAVVVTLFLGGWSVGFGADAYLAGICPWLAVLCQFIMFLVKLYAFIFFFVWVRWTLPRFRWDQVMKLGWLVFLEVAVANIFLAAAVLYFIK
ncbi:MAG: NADH-quinone oxidoreductase subunit H [Akkermansia sp.]|nr:NADH-quinone oxidoreductase subunit H [Akkermansia sp.]